MCDPFLVPPLRNTPPHLWGGALRDHTKNGCAADHRNRARQQLTYDTRAAECSTEAKRQVFDCWPQGERCILALIQAR